jgi:hypothetical protein
MFFSGTYENESATNNVAPTLYEPDVGALVPYCHELSIW